MLTREEYLAKIRNEKIDNLKNNLNISPSDVFSNVNLGTSRNTWQRFIDTQKEVGTSLWEGMFGFADQIGDFVINLSENAGWLDSATAESARTEDWVATATKAVNMGNDLLTGDIFESEYWNDYHGTARDYVNKSKQGSYLNDIFTQEGADIGRQAVTTIGNLLPSIIAGMATGGAATALGAGATGVNIATQAGALATTGIGAYAGGTNKAIEEGADFGDANLYGLLSGTVEVGTELALGKVLAKIGVGTGKVAGAIGAGTSKGGGIAKDLFKTMFEEGAEEFTSAMLEPLISMTYKDKDQALSSYTDNDFWYGNNDSVLTQTLMGGAIGGLFGGANIAHNVGLYGKNGYKVLSNFQEMSDITKELKVEKNVNKKTQLVQELVALGNEQAKAVNLANETSSDTQKENLARILAEPKEFIKLQQEENKNVFNEFLSAKSNEFNNIDSNQYLAKEFIKNFNQNYNSDYKIEFSDKLDSAGSIKENTIVLNNKYKEQFVPLIAHELVNHALFDSLIKTKNYLNLSKIIQEQGLTSEEIKQVREDYSELNEKQIQSEIIGRYFEKVFANKTYKELDTKILDHSFTSAMRNFFAKKDIDTAILKSAKEMANMIYKATNSNYRILNDKSEKGYKLSDDEETKLSKMRIDTDLDNKEVRELANKKEGKVISLKNTKQTAQEIINYFEDSLGAKISQKQKYYNELYQTYNLMGRANIEKFINHIFKSPVGEDMLVKDIIKSSGQTIKETRLNLVNAVEQVMNKQAKDSDIVKLINRVDHLQNQIRTIRLNTKQFLRLKGQVEKLKDEIKWNKTNTITSDIKANEANALKVIVSGIVTTKGGHISGTWRTKFHEIDSRFYEQLLNSPFNQADELTEAIDTFKYLGESYDKTIKQQHYLSTEEGSELLNAMGQLNVALKNYKSGVYEEIGKIAQANFDIQNPLFENKRNSKTENRIISTINSVMNPLQVSEIMFGGKQSSLYKEIVAPLVKAYDTQSLKEVEYLNEMNKAIGDTKSEILKRSKQLINFKGEKGAYRSTLYSLYLNLHTYENAIKFQNGGGVFTTKSGKKVNIDYTENLVNEIDNLLTTEEKIELDNLKHMLNRNGEGSIKYYTRDKQIELEGFTNVYEELDYFPLVSSESKEMTDIGSKQASGFGLDATNLSNVKSRTKANYRIRLENPIRIVEKYIANTTKYGEYGKIERHNTRVLNKKLNGNNSLWKMLNNNIPEFNKHYTSLINKFNGNPLEGVSKVGWFTKSGTQIAKSLLAFSPTTVAKQIGSLPTAFNLLSPKAFVEGVFKSNTYNFKKMHNYLLKNSGVYAKRILERGSINAETMANITLGKAQNVAYKFYNKFIDFGLLGMIKADQMYVLIEFGYAQQQAKIETGFEIGTKENLKHATTILNEILLTTQSNSDPIATSMLRSGEMGSFAFNLFGRFGSDLQQKFSILSTNIIQANNLRKNVTTLEKMIANETNKELKSSLENELANTKKALGKYQKSVPYSASLVLVSSALTVGLVTIIKMVLGQKDKEEITMENMFAEIVENTFVDSIPILSHIYNYWKYGGEVNVMSLDPYIDMFTTLGDSISKGELNQKQIKDLIFAVSKIVGLPTENIYKLTYGAMYQFNAEEAIKHKSIFYGYSDSYLSSQYHSAKNDNMQGLAIKRLHTLMERAKSGTTSYQVRKELYRLDYLPKNRLDYDFNLSFYEQVNPIVEQTINSKSYQALTDDQKINTLEKLYNAYHDGSKMETTTKFGRLVKGGVDISKMVLYYEQFTTIKADRLQTRKEKIIKKINRTQLSFNDKLVLTWLLGFKPSENYERRLKNYLKGKGINYE